MISFETFRIAVVPELNKGRTENSLPRLTEDKQKELYDAYLRITNTWINNKQAPVSAHSYKV